MKIEHLRHLPLDDSREHQVGQWGHPSPPSRFLSSPTAQDAPAD